MDFSAWSSNDTTLVIFGESQAVLDRYFPPAVKPEPYRPSESTSKLGVTEHRQFG